MSIVSTSAVTLRSFPYGDTSLIMRFHTADLGVVGVIGKGLRKGGSKGRGMPELFTGGTLTLYHRPGRGLQTYKDFAVERPRRGLGRQLFRFAAASVQAEIVLRHAGEEENPALHRLLETGLDRLEGAPPEVLFSTFLAQGWGLVAQLGYRPILERCVVCGAGLEGSGMGRFDFDAGGIRCSGCRGKGAGPRIGPGAREELRGLLSDAPPREVTVLRPHVQLLSDFITYHISGTRPLSSFRFLFELLPEEEDRVPSPPSPS